MQKSIVAMMTLCGAGVVMAQSTPAATPSDSSKMVLWGIVDAAVRHTNNQGVEKKSKTEMIGGGMSQSRWGLNIEEDLGSGAKAIAYLEHRFNTDTGDKNLDAPYFQLSYVGLQSPSYGRLTMGRQWNVLFDVVTSTYPSFPYSPYMDAYKPELGMSVGGRTSNMLKYTFATPTRDFVGSLQYSFKENNDTKDIEAGFPANATKLPDLVRAKVYQTIMTRTWETFGGYLRYSANGVSVGAGYLHNELPGGTEVDAYTLGGAYRTGPWYFSTGYGLNKAKFATPTSATSPIVVRNAVDRAMLSAAWSKEIENGGFGAGDADKRQMFKLGVGYQFTPQLNVGMHYYHAKQSGSTSGAFNGKANFLVMAADYAFSKRTDAYVAIDNTRISGGGGIVIDDTSKARSRTGFTVGVRHRF